jgi:hypothetical protein
MRRRAAIGGCLGEGVVLVGQGVALLGDGAAADVEFLDAALRLDQVDQPGLVAVDQATMFGRGGLGLAVQPAELGGE